MLTYKVIRITKGLFWTKIAFFFNQTKETKRLKTISSVLIVNPDKLLSKTSEIYKIGLSLFTYF